MLSISVHISNCLLSISLYNCYYWIILFCFLYYYK